MISNPYCHDEYVVGCGGCPLHEGRGVLFAQLDRLVKRCGGRGLEALAAAEQMREIWGKPGHGWPCAFGVNG